MRFVLKYPLWSGLAWEALVVLLFCVFPYGACNSPLVGVAVVLLHYPALIFVERVLNIGSGTALLSAVLMIPVWIGTIYLLRFVLIHARKATNASTD